MKRALSSYTQVSTNNIYALDINGVLSETYFEILVTRLLTTTIHNDAML